MRSWTHNQQTMTPLANGWPSQMPVYSYVPQIGKGPLETAPYVYFDCSRTGYANTALWLDGLVEYRRSVPVLHQRTADGRQLHHQSGRLQYGNSREQGQVPNTQRRAR